MNIPQGNNKMVSQETVPLITSICWTKPGESVAANKRRTGAVRPVRGVKGTKVTSGNRGEGGEGTEVTRWEQRGRGRGHRGDQVGTERKGERAQR